MSTEAENEYERMRQANIARKNQLLQALQLNVGALGPPPVKSKKGSPKPKPRGPRVKKEPKAPTEPRRTSARLAGIKAESPEADRKRAADDLALQNAERAGMKRVKGDLSFDVARGLLGDYEGGSGKWEKRFTEEDVKETKDTTLRSLREKMMGLKLWEEFEPNEIKICPERIYHLSFHPTVDKPLVFAGDKVGNLGIFNASAPKETSDGPVPDISHFKLHTRTISTLQFDVTTANILYTASYDGSVRRFDLTKGVATEFFVPGDSPSSASDADEAFSGLEVLDSNTLLFSTLDGAVGRRDLRSKHTEIWQLSEKKIGGFSSHPEARHLIATASLDRTVKIWDLRNVKKEEDEPALKAEHTSRLSVSCAQWNSNGTLATTSYDDTVKLYNFPNATSWSPEFQLGEIEPTTVIRHNNQTGRWVTILRAQWQKNPPNGAHKFVIANMNRFIDIYSEAGEQLAQLGDERITAVPAVVQFHPSLDWVAGGTGSGKIVLFT